MINDGIAIFAKNITNILIGFFIQTDAMDQWLANKAVSAEAFDDIVMTMQVHDELVFEVPENILDSAVAKITSIMSDAAQLKVPLIVEAGVGNNWDEAH